MGRTNYSYNGMLSAIARKPLHRFTSYEKNSSSISTIFGNEYSTINKRGNDSLTSIVSNDFNTPEEYLKNTNVGPIILITGARTVNVNQNDSYSDLGATARDGEDITTDTSAVDTSTPGTYTVTYTATETIDSVVYTRVEKRYVKVVATGAVADPTGTPDDPFILTVSETAPHLASGLTLYRGKTYKFDYTSFASDPPIQLTTSVASPQSDSVKWDVGIRETGDRYFIWTVPETVPDTMYWYYANASSTNDSLTIEYPTDRALPTRYKIRWLDPYQIFPAKIDRDNMDNALARIENLFTGRRPISEAAGLHYDTTMTMAGNPSLDAAARGGPTASDYEGMVFSGWTESGAITWKATQDTTTVAGNDGLYDDSGVAKNSTEMTMAHEALHALGVGSSFSIIGRNYNGNTGLMIRHPTDPGAEGSENYLWTGANALAWYKTHFGSTVSTDIEGVPMKTGDSAHWDDNNSGGRAVERTINGKTYLAIWDEIVTATGGDYITGMTVGMLKDVGLSIDMSNVETPPLTTVAKTWAFDVGAGLTLTPNTSTYSNVYTATSLAGTNPEIIIEPGDVVKLNILAGGASVRVYSPTSSGVMEWDPLTSGITSGTLSVEPTSANVEQWLYNSVFYTDGTNQGKITVKDIVYDEGRDHDDDGVYNNRDPQSLAFVPEYTIFTGLKSDANMKWQGSSTGYYSSNTVTTTNFPLYKSYSSATEPASGFTSADGEPWALSAAVVCGRRKAGWAQDSGIVLLSAQGGADGNVTLSTHENKETGAFYAKFKYGDFEMTTSNIEYNHYYTGFYVDYDGATGFRLFTYDYKTETLSQATPVSADSVGQMRAANFEIAKTPGATRYWNGKISHVTVTTLRTGVALPTNAEVLSMIKTPDQWLTNYKVGNPFRLPGATSDASVPVTPTSLTLDIFTFYRLNGDLVYTQGSYASPNLSISAELARGATYEIDLTDTDLTGKEIRLSTSSVYHIDLASAQSNIYTSNVTYESDKITILAGDDTPDYLYLFDNLGSATPRDGPINFTGSGYAPTGSTPVSFAQREFGYSDSTDIQKSAQATKVYFFTGLLAGGPTVPNPTESFINQVSYDATEHFLVNN